MPEITADPLALESIFGNLITNAIKYSPNGDNIIVRGVSQNGRVRLDVEDHGIGISEENQKLRELVVISGKGGTGKTTIATNLAVSIGSGVQLLDCDVEEPNDVLFFRET